jgi:hypothetical protein
MPGYQTTTGSASAGPAMPAGSSLFRALLTIGSGYTVTGWQLDFFYGGQSSAPATGFTSGSEFSDLGLKTGLAYGPNPFTPAGVLPSPDQPGMLWYQAGEDYSQVSIVPASTTWQQAYGWRIRARGRTQFRTTAATDFCVLVGNNGSATLTFNFTATCRVTWA